MTEDYSNMKEAMDIFLKYPDSEGGTVMAEGKLIAGPHPDIVSPEDKKKLFHLNWLVSPTYECFEFAGIFVKDEFEYTERIIETGIPCFNCKKNSGIDCAGRAKDESTLCQKCLEENLIKLQEESYDHIEKMLDEKMSPKDTRFLQDELRRLST